MTLASTGDLVGTAAAERRALAAVNLITLEHAEAIVAAAERVGSPVALQLSENAIRFHGGRMLPILRAVVELAGSATVPVAVHLDHLTQDAVVAEAMAAPVSSLMYDAGALPYEDNLTRTRKVTDQAHQHGLWVEAELGYVGGKDGVAQSAHQAGVRTDPDQAAEFVATTGVDALAVAVGSSHAMTARTADLDIDLVAALAQRVEVPLVLHGSSGVPHDVLRNAVAAGIVKVNLGTALNVAMTQAIRSALQEDESVDPRRYLGLARDAMINTVCEVLDVVAGG